MTDDVLVITERHDNGVALVRLNRPPLNPLSCALLDAISSVAEELAADPTVKAVVVTGSDRAFAAGADISEFTDPVASQLIGPAFRRAIDALPAIPRPVIAAISGYALGGGLEIALACDLRIAGDSARVGFPEILLGIFPGGGGTQRLPRLVGPRRPRRSSGAGARSAPTKRSRSGSSTASCPPTTCSHRLSRGRASSRPARSSPWVWPSASSTKASSCRSRLRSTSSRKPSSTCVKPTTARSASRASSTTALGKPSSRAADPR